MGPTLSPQTDKKRGVSVAGLMVNLMKDPDSILAALDPEQRRVAEALHGPVVVMAGAGTGKTRAMTHRIAYGVARGAYEPRAVLALTFTTRAAGEMRGRLRSLGVSGVQARTFHSAALRQAQYFWPRVHGSALPPVADNKISIVAEALRRERIEPDSSVLRDCANEISWAKVTNVAPEDYAAVAPRRGRQVNGHSPEQVGRILARYEQAKAGRDVIDFDDILLCTAALLAGEAEVAAEVRRTYRHLVVDEYQDVSPLQQALLDLWRGDSEELCVVGDPAQTIHSFAGAESSFLTTFVSRHPSATVVELVRDYRSTPQVVNLANRLVQGAGPSVQLRAMREPGPAPIFAAAGSETAEADGVVRWLQQRATAGTPWAEMAVLYRVHAQAPALEAALAESGIPFLTRGSEGFFERIEVRQALRAVTARAETVDDGTPPHEQLRAVLADLGWTTEPPQGQGAARERWESWDALVSLGDHYVHVHPEATLADLVTELQHRAATQHAPSGEGVTLSTLHAAKGLEWDAVALTGVHEGSIPFVLATTPAHIAEERRLLYVGVTRARQDLRLSWATTRNGGGHRRPPSRFLDGLIDTPHTTPPAPRRRRRGRGSALSKVCRVCSTSLGSPAERKLGRHEDCPSSYDEAMWESLRQWRKETAAEASMPAFVIFTDATLLAIAEQEPADLHELSHIPGVGPTKLERYGSAVLAIVNAHR